MVQVALLFWPPGAGVAALTEGQAVLMNLPDRHFGSMNVISGPPAPFVPERWQGEPGFVVGVAGDGTADDLADAVAPLRAFTPAPAWELVAEMPYPALQQLFDGIAPWGDARLREVAVPGPDRCRGPDQAGFAAEREWVRDFWTELRPFARAEQGYVNFMSDTGQEQVAQTYGAKYGRLRAVKATWDPADVFRHNANIPSGVC